MPQNNNEKQIEAQVKLLLEKERWSLPAVKEKVWFQYYMYVANQVEQKSEQRVCLNKRWNGWMEAKVWQ